MNADIAWAAGLFEGEGTISIRSCKSPPVSIGLGSTDRDVVERFAAIVKAGAIYGPYNPPPHKPCWHWHASGLEDMSRVLHMLEPQFGERRRAKAAEALAIIDAKIRAWKTPMRCLECDRGFMPGKRPERRKYCSVRCNNAAMARKLASQRLAPRVEPSLIS